MQSSFGLTLMVLAHLLDEKKAGNDVEDLGYMLHWFFKRYGTLYDPARMAVSVRHGGTVPRQTVDALWDKKLDRICCIDPLTGLDCTEGTYRAEEVLEAFARADQQLAKLAARHAESCPPDLDILAKLSQLASGQLDDEEEEEELLAEIDQSNDEDEAAQGAGVPEQQGVRGSCCRGGAHVRICRLFGNAIQSDQLLASLPSHKRPRSSAPLNPLTAWSLHVCIDPPQILASSVSQSYRLTCFVANKLPSPHELLGLSDEGNQAPPPQQQYHTQPPLRHQHQRSNREQQGSSSSESSESDGSVQGNGEAATAGNDSGACHGDAAQGRGAEAALSSSRTQEGGEIVGGGSRGRGSGVSEQGSKGGGMGRRKSGPPSRGAQAELVGLTRHNSAPIGVNEVPGASGAASRDAGGSGSNKSHMTSESCQWSDSTLSPVYEHEGKHKIFHTRELLHASIPLQNRTANRSFDTNLKHGMPGHSHAQRQARLVALLFYLREMLKPAPSLALQDKHSEFFRFVFWETGAAEAEANFGRSPCRTDRISARNLKLGRCSTKCLMVYNCEMNIIATKMGQNEAVLGQILHFGPFPLEKSAKGVPKG
uniref:PAP-associated domain-containing protein n=1 Tax=Dunaliella viridis TaxID=140095 RepID=A7U4W5_9CHLO|nr:hypothetical protein [Dunaliella viridis]